MACYGEHYSELLPKIAELIPSKLGYWGGISPENSIAKKYQTREVRIDNKDGVLINHARVVEAEDIPKIYDDFYK